MGCLKPPCVVISFAAGSTNTAGACVCFGAGDVTQDVDLVACVRVCVCLNTCLGVWLFGSVCVRVCVGVAKGCASLFQFAYVSVSEEACVHTHVCAGPPPPSSFITSSLGLMLWVNKI